MSLPLLCACHCFVWFLSLQASFHMPYRVWKMGDLRLFLGMLYSSLTFVNEPSSNWLLLYNQSVIYIMHSGHTTLS